MVLLPMVLLLPSLSAAVGAGFKDEHRATQIGPLPPQMFKRGTPPDPCNHAVTATALIFSLSGPWTKRTMHSRRIRSQATRSASSLEVHDRVTASLFNRRSK